MKAHNKITSILLAVVFLISSLGFTVNKMVCIKSGKTKFSLTALTDCCKGKKTEGAVIKKKCCLITNSTFNLGNYQNSKKINVENTIVLENSSTRTDKTNCIESTANSKVTAYADLPPPLHGRDLLSFISTLII